MRFAKTFASLVCAGAFATVACTGPTAAAQCQGGQGPGGASASTAAATPYTQTALAGGYNQNSLNPLGYNQQPLATMMALDQTSRNMRAMTALQVQYQSQALRNQVALAQSMRKQMNKASAEMRKAAQQEKAENLALREERESAKRSKNYESQRSLTRLASVQ